MSNLPESPAPFSIDDAVAMQRATDEATKADPAFPGKLLAALKASGAYPVDYEATIAAMNDAMVGGTGIVKISYIDPESIRATPAASDTEMAELRVAFERWYCDVYWNFKSTRPNMFNGKEYDESVVQLAWASWQMASDRARIAQSAPAVEPPKLDTEQSREYLVEFMMKHFTDKTYHRYIRGQRGAVNLAGDFAWQMARALRQLAAAPTPPAQPAPSGLYEAIKHGDDAHRAWLKAAIEAFYADLPMPAYVPSQPAPDLSAQLAEWERLRDPVVLHASLLKGEPAQLTPEQLRHIAGADLSARDAGVAEACEIVNRAVNSLSLLHAKAVASLNPAISGKLAMVHDDLARAWRLLYAPAAPSDARDAQGEAS